MKQTVTLYDFRNAFREMNRDHFSYEGYEVLFDFLEEVCGDDMELDVVAICCDFTEYDEDGLRSDYGYLLEGEFDEEETQEEGFDEVFLERLLEELDNQTTVLRVGRYGPWIVQAF